MTVLRIIPDERGCWKVLSGSGMPLSEKHLTVTHAEAAARAYAEATDEILVLDRYHRFRRVPSRRSRDAHDA
jgi:hypothetical protein